MAPTFQLVTDPKPGFASTFVVAVAWREPQRASEAGPAIDDGPMLRAYALTQIMPPNHASALALVETENVARYLVITVPERAMDKYKYKLLNQVSSLAGAPQVMWARPLTRRLQRLLGWGDAGANREDVKSAARDGDAEELLTIMPSASSLIRRGELDILPALHDAIRTGLPALNDCEHEFFTENAYQRVCGPCGLDVHHRGFFTRCGKCGATRCKLCARQSDGIAERQLDLTRAYHEVQGMHRWQVSKSAECTVCGRIPAQVCDCGARWCGACVAPREQASLRMQPRTSILNQNAAAPADFFVIDQKKVPEEEKIAWVTREIGDDKGLTKFASKFLDLFGEKIRGAPAQKQACLTLYRKYARIETREDLERHEYEDVATARKNLYTNGHNVPPSELEDFLYVWNPDALRRCHECDKELPACTPYGEQYCSADCSEAALKVLCRKCGPAGKISLRDGCRVCTTCGEGSAIAECVAATAGMAEGTELDRSLKRNADALKIANNILGGFSTTRDPNHVAAWTKRRRL